MPSALAVPIGVLRRLFRWKMVFTIIASLGTATTTALQGMDWGASSAQTRFTVTVGIFVSVSIAIKSLIDDTAGKLARGELPFGEASDPLPGTIQQVHTTQDKTITTPPASQ